MKPIYKRYLKILLVLWGGSFAVLTVLYLFLLLPQNNILNFSKDELRRLNIEYQTAKTTSSPETRAKQKAEIQELNKTLNTFVTNYNNLDNLTFSISRIASDIRVDTFANKGSNSDSYLKIPTCKHVGFIDATISFRATFNKFVVFINTLERHNPVIFIDELTIIQQHQGGSRHKAEIFLNFLIKIPEEDKLDEGEF